MQESNLHKIRAEKTQLQRALKQAKRKVEKMESANGGAAAVGILTDGGWDLAVERGKRLSAAEGTVINLNSKCRSLEHKILRFQAAKDMASGAEQAIKLAEEEVKLCIAESLEPYPYPDFETKMRSGRAVSASEYKESRGGAAAGLSSLLGAGPAGLPLEEEAAVRDPAAAAGPSKEEEAALKQRVDELSEEATSKQALVAKLQGQINQLAQTIGEKRDAISDHDVAHANE